MSQIISLILVPKLDFKKLQLKPDKTVSFEKDYNWLKYNDNGNHHENINTSYVLN